MSQTIYIKMNESVVVHHREVTIGDLTKVLCDNKSLRKTIEQTKVTEFKEKGKSQICISVLIVIKLIQALDKSADITNEGVSDAVVYYKKTDPKDRAKQNLKSVFICFIAFLGAGFTIISYNSDVNMVGQLDLMTQLFTDNGEGGRAVAGIAYSVGLFIGIIIFFNHGAKKKFMDDPTPLQVQMRKYEQEVNESIVTDAMRNNELIEVDSNND